MTQQEFECNLFRLSVCTQDYTKKNYQSSHKHKLCAMITVLQFQIYCFTDQPERLIIFPVYKMSWSHTSYRVCTPFCAFLTNVLVHLPRQMSLLSSQVMITKILLAIKGWTIYIAFPHFWVMMIMIRINTNWQLPRKYINPRSFSPSNIVFHPTSKSANMMTSWLKKTDSG